MNSLTQNKRAVDETSFSDENPECCKSLPSSYLMSISQTIAAILIMLSVNVMFATPNLSPLNETNYGLIEDFNDPLNCNTGTETLSDSGASCEGTGIYDDFDGVVKFDRSFSGTEYVYLKTTGYACCGETLVNPKSGPVCYNRRIAGPTGLGFNIVEGGNVDPSCDFSSLEQCSEDLPTVATVNCAHENGNQHPDDGPVGHRITFLGSIDGDVPGETYWYYKVENKVNDCRSVKGISHLTFAYTNQTACCVPAATCNLTNQSDDCVVDIDELGDFATNFPPETDYTMVFKDVETCGSAVSPMTYQDTNYNVDIDLGVDVTYSVTRTYSITIDGEVFTCSQILTVTNPVPTINNGDDLVPGDIPNVDFEGCLPTGDINGSFSNDLIVDCAGNGVNDDNVLIDVISVTGTDCAWTLNIRTTVTLGNGDVIVIRDDSIDGGDQVKPVITVDEGVAPDGSDFGCVIPPAPTFSATDNCAEGLVPMVTTDGPTGDPCARTQTWKANVSDGCNDADEVIITYTWVEADAVDVSGPAPVSTEACFYADDAALQAAYTAWLAGFVTDEAGCGNGGSFEGDVPAAADLSICSDVDITLTYSASDSCTNDSVTVNFSATAADAVDVSGPAPVSTEACFYADDAALQAAYTAWLAGFVTDEAGCGNGGSFEGDVPAAADLSICSDVDITLTYSASDSCTNDSVTVNFSATAADAVDVSGPAPVSTEACFYADDAALQAAYTAWLAGFVTDEAGCGNGGSFEGDVPAAADLSICSDVDITLTYSASDSCTNDSVTVNFSATAADAVDVSGPAPVSTEACFYADDTALQAAYTAWLAGFVTDEAGCGNGGSFEGDVPAAADLSICSDVDITLTYSASDSCTNDSVTVNFSATAADAVDVSGPAPVSTEACFYADDAALQAAYTAWLAGFVTDEAGCGNGGSFEGDVPAAADLSICSDVDITLTYSASDSCTNDSVTVNFSATAADAVDVSGPAPVSTEACFYADDAALQAAYTAWLAGFVTDEAGCGNGGSFEGDVPAAADLSICSDVDITLTYSASDSCTNDSVTVNFSATAADAVDVSGPAPVSTEACFYADDAALQAAYTAWLAGFVTDEAGCGNGGSFEGDVPAAADLSICSDVDITLTYSASDSCTNDSVTVNFSATAADAVDVSGPAPVSTEACFYADDAALQAAYTAWLAGFVTDEAGCGNGGSFEGDVPAAADLSICSDVDITLTYSASDSCTNDSVTVNFSATAADAVDVSGPAPVSTEACFYTDDAALQAAYTAWLAGFVTDEAGCGNGGSFEGDVPAAADLSICSDVDITLTYSASDSCTNDSVTVNFSATAADAVDVSGPAPVSTEACFYADDAALQAAYTAWLAGFVTDEAGCGNGGSFEGDVPAAADLSICSDVDITLTYSASDSCTNDSVTVNFSATAADAVIDVSGPAPVSTEACFYADDAALQAAYTAWLAGFVTDEAGCGNGGSFEGDVPAAADLSICSDVDITLTYSASDSCTNDSVTVNFSATAADAVDVSGPAPVSTEACFYADDAALQAAYTAWLAGFVTDEAGCGNGGSFEGDVPAAADLSICSDVDITLTYSASDSCTNDSVTVNFSATAADAVDVSGPAPVSTEACFYADDAALQAAYTAWLAGFVTDEAGCGNGGSFEGDVPAAANLSICSDVDITLTYSASDSCTNDSVTVNFSSVGSDAVIDVSGPAPVSTEACFYADDAALQAAYTAWLAGFVTDEAGCGNGGSFEGDVPAAADLSICSDVDITLTYSASDSCTNDSVTVNFSATAADAVDVSGPAPVSTEACFYADDAALQAAYTAWLAGFVTDEAGCGNGGSFEGDVPAAADLSICSDVDITLTYSASDSCTNDSVTVNFSATAADAVDVSGPAPVSTEACFYADDAALQAAYTAWLAGFVTDEAGCGNGGSFEGDVPAAADLSICSDVDITLTYSASDSCTNDSVTVNFSATAADAVDVSGPAPVSTEACFYADDAALQAAYTAWLAGFVTDEAGCGNGGSFEGDVPAAADLSICSDVDITLTYSASDSCTNDSVTVNFSATAADAVDVSGPAPVSTEACFYADDAALQAAYTAWLAGFVTDEAGCGNGGSFEGDVPAAADLSICSDVDITLTYSASDSCTNDSVTVNFSATAADAVDVSGPAPVSTEACFYADDAALQAAYTAWLAGFVTDEAGCGNGGSFEGDVPAAADLSICSDVDITLTYSASDSCTNDSVTVNFSATAADAVDVSGPAPVSTEACFYADDAALQAAYTAWLAGFVTDEAGCGNGGSFEGDVPAAADLSICSDVDITLTYSASDSCTNDSVTVNFSATAADAVDVSGPAPVSTEACFYADDAALQAAYTAWLAGFVTDEAGCGNGGSFEGDVPAAADLSICSDVDITLTYSASDSCTNDSVTVNFSATAADAVDVSGPAPVSTEACFYADDAALQAAYTAWLAGFVTDEAGCGNGGSFEGDVPAAADLSICSDVDITLTYSASDSCTNDSVTVNFSATAADAVDVSGPAPVSTEACFYADDAALQAAYTAWLAGFVTDEAGCGNGGSFEGDVPAAADLSICSDVDITLTYSASDSCTNDSVTVNFSATAADAVDVSGPAPVSTEACFYADDAALQAAYTAWLAGFVTDEAGCGNGGSFEGDVPAAADLSICSDVDITLTYSASDSCTNDSVTVNFSATAADAVDVSGPAPVSTEACFYADDAALQAAYTAWLAGFVTDEAGCGNGGSFEGDVPAAADLSICSDVDITLTYSASDSCTNDSVTVNFSATAADAVDVSGPAPVSTEACFYADDAALQAAYTAWLAGFVTDEAGCGNGGSFEGDVPAAADLSICSDVDITLTYSASDSCTNDSVTVNFSATAADAVDVSGPAPVSTEACFYADDAALQAAYTAWLAGFVTDEAGCGNGGSFEGDVPAAADLSICSDVDITLTYSASDSCTNDSVTVNFSATAADAVDVSGPAPVSTEACFYADDAALQAAYTAWLAGFVTDEAGCGNGGSFEGDVPSADDLSICSDVDITLTYSASDSCTNDSVTVNFSATAADAVDVSGPAAVDASACDYTDDSQLQEQYQAWLDTFMVDEAGCGAVGSFNTTPPTADTLDICGGTDITLTYSADDGCTSDMVTVSFKVSADMPPVLECPIADEGSDSIFLGCNPESSNGIPNAIVTSVPFTDDCDGSGMTSGYSDNGGVTFDDVACEYSLTRTFSYTDRCDNTTECSVTYTWKIPETETAFGFLNDDVDPSTADDESQCFITDEDENFNRWGWTTKVDFSEQSSYEFDIYQGAGQCDLFRGTDVGSVNVVYNGDSVTFTYNLVGYALSESHIYIGCDPYPTKPNGSSTVAPGQYTYVDSGFGYVENYSVTIPVDGTVFNVIIHGVTSESQCSCLTDTSVENPMMGNYSGGIIEECDDNEAKIAAVSSTDFSVSPVPFKDNVTVSYEFDYDTDVTIEIYDMKGALVAKTVDAKYVAGRKGQSTIDTSRLEQSMYLVHLRTKEGTMVKKIVSGAYRN